MNTADIRTSTDPDLAGSYAAMLRAARSAEDLAIRTNTCILVSIDGKDVRLTAQDLLRRREQEAKSQPKNSPTGTSTPISSAYLERPRLTSQWP